MNALDLIALCQQVYAGAHIVAGPDGRDGASVFLSNERAVIAFRGTQASPSFSSALDWLNDFHAELVQDDGYPGRVHSGFLASINDLWDGVLAATEAPPYASPPWRKNLIITGHSKGGALAVLAGVKLAALNPQVITFAAPRCGDLTFANYYPSGAHVTNYCGLGDIVPFLPPREMGYEAAGCAIGQDGESLYLRRHRVGEMVAEGRWEEIAAAHHLSTYREWIGKLHNV